VSGFELRIASICTVKVKSSLKVKRCLRITLLRRYLVDLTSASHNPPKCGAAGGLKCQVTPTFDIELAILGYEYLISLMPPVLLIIICTYEVRSIVTAYVSRFTSSRDESS